MLEMISILIAVLLIAAVSYIVHFIRRTINTRRFNQMKNERNEEFNNRVNMILSNASQRRADNELSNMLHNRSM